MCTCYWPDAEDNKMDGKVQVKNLKETPNPFYILREFLVHREEVRHRGKRAKVCSEGIPW